MILTVLKDYESISDWAANEIATAIRKDATLCLCMASGHTPALTCQLLVEKLLQEKIDYASIFFIGLDEWANLPATDEGSCHYFFKTKLIDPLKMPPSQYHLFNAMATDLNEECDLMDAMIEKKTIDLMLVGIGMNGHIGFNEPGTPFTSLSHIAKLDETTKTVGQKYFSTAMELQLGITTGLAHLMQAKKAILMANGTKKASVIKQMIEEPVTENFPASILQMHSNATVLVDEEAASLLNQAK